MTKKWETKWEIFFSVVLLTPLGFQAIIGAIIGAVAYWNGYYFVATFFAGTAWTALIARAVQRDVDVLSNEIDEKFERVSDRISEIKGK